jgi:hypothetical protein
MKVLITATFCILHFSACYELINLGNVNEKRDSNRFISRDRSLLIDVSNVADLERYCPHKADGKFQPCKDKFSNIKVLNDVCMYVCIYLFVYLRTYTYIFEHIITYKDTYLYTYYK